MKILRVISTLNPEYGGPVEGAFQQTVELLKQGHRVDVVTLDAPHSAYLSAFPGTIHALGPSLGKYRLNFRLVPWLVKHSRNYDLVIVNGIWQFHSLGVRLAALRTGMPYFIYTHGMLDPWFKTAYPFKHLKKLVYWLMAENRVLRGAAGVLFTSEEEKLLAHASFSPYKVNAMIVGYGIQKPPENSQESKKDFLQAFPHLSKAKFILFLSRMHPKKGCDLLIDAFAGVSASHPQLQLVMAGPDPDGWVPQLKIRAEKLGVAGRITWTGMLKDNLKWGAYRAADVFILPTHSENFGIVLAEAMACRLPVLTTNKVNIWREIKQDGAGIIGEDTPGGIIDILKQWLSLPGAQREAMRQNAETCFENRYNINRAPMQLLSQLQARVDQINNETSKKEPHQ